MTSTNQNGRRRRLRARPPYRFRAKGKPPAKLKPFQLPCRACGQGFYGVLTLMQHRDRCERETAHEDRPGSPNGASDDGTYAPTHNGFLPIDPDREAGRRRTRGRRG